ncbi:MAG: ABC transporter permease [Muribaculaceae bacterium]|nr:ABC transporter permease [Muribaculaceae bacterium]
MNSYLGIIISREFLQRVKRKSFLITTILMPVIMLALMMAPAVIAALAEPEKQTIAVIDDSGDLGRSLHSDDNIKFNIISDNLADAKLNDDFDAILVIGKNSIKDPSGSISLYSHSAPSMVTEQAIVSQLEKAIENRRIKEYNIDNLRQIMEEVSVDISLQTYRLDKEDETATSSMLSYILGVAMMFILYMFILLYGQMVMTSIIEEKNNRVLEVVVSSVKPNTLMMGKILGIGAVAVTQILIWAVLIVVGGMLLMPWMSAMASSVDEPAFTGAIDTLSDPAFVTQLIVFMFLFLVGGFLLYSSIFAAIGSAVDNIQDASQLQTIAIMPILFAMIISMTVVNDPNSSLAVWTSMIPFTSPMVMMSRLPFGIPLWQPVVSTVILFISFMVMIWVAAKIYRVGIFMYGKKPSFADLVRWFNYK